MKGRRALDIGAMTTQVALKEIENLTAKLFLSKEARREKDIETQEQIAEIVFSKFSQLKGTGLKLLQALALDEDLLPKPYIKKFEAAYGKVAPITRPVVKKVIKSELGNAPEDLFAEFDYNAMAAASLGQVHLARLNTGDEVVVKVQYPNVADNMQADMNFIKGVAKAVGNPLVRSSIEELSESLIAETDYRKEAENLVWFDNLPEMVGLKTPKLFAEFSTQRVLTMSRIPGTPLSADLSSEPRNQVLQMAFDYFFHTLTLGSCIHADPHPGNFLSADAHIGVVDFGSIKKNIPKEVVELFLLLVTPNADTQRIIKLYNLLGADTEGSEGDFYLQHVGAYHRLGSELLSKDQLDFSKLRPSISEMRRTLFLNSRKACLQGLSSEFTLLHKAFQSLLFLMCKYKATISTERFQTYIQR
ncbi:MAG: AarF/UbiB family protein [Pseudomonadota bacterium]